MAKNMYWKTGLTGGGGQDLDGIDGANLNDLDGAIVITAAGFYIYTLDADSGLGESSPDRIVPDSNPGTKVWINHGVSLANADTLDTLHAAAFGQLATAAEWTTQQNFNEAAITSTSNATAWNLDTAQCAYHNMTENTTISSPTNMNAGGTYILRIEGNGSATLSWNAVFKWGTGSAPAAPAADGDIIICSFYSDGTNMYGVETLREEA